VPHRAHPKRFKSGVIQLANIVFLHAVEESRPIGRGTKNMTLFMD
jgi:hypothetical protein